MTKIKKSLLIVMAALTAVCFSIGLWTVISANRTVAAAVPDDEGYIVVEPGGTYDADRLLVIDGNGRWTGIEANYKDDDGTVVYWPSNMGKVHLILPTRVKTIAAGTSSISGINAAQYPISKISFADEENSLFEKIESSTVTNWSWTGGNDTTQNLGTEDVLTSNLSGAFDGNTSLHQIIFPNNGKHQTIGAFAFHACSNASAATGDGLQHVEFRTTGGVTIERGAFSLCYGLRTVDCNTAAVTAGAEDSSIGEFAFSRCHKLYRAVFPSNLKTIGKRAFSHVYGSNNAVMLTDLAIGNKVTSIGENAFDGAGLIRFVVPESLTVSGIGSDAFANCSKMMEVKNNSAIALADLRNYFGSAVMNFYGNNTGNTDSYLVRDNNGVVFCRNSSGRWLVTSYADIYEHQFKTGRLLLKLPNGISSSTSRWKPVYSYSERINDIKTLVYEDDFSAKGEYDYLDYDGTPLKNNLASTVTEYDIGASAFKYVWMPYVEIPDSVVNIGANAFMGSHVVSVVLGERVKSIGAGAFNANASSLDGGHRNELTVYMPENYSQITYGSNAFYGTSGYVGRFIYKNKADYDASATTGTRPQFNNAAAIYTYLMPVTYHVLDTAGNEVGTKTVEKVNSLGYSFTRNEVNVWESDVSAANAMPNINDISGVDKIYSSTVWYTPSADGSNKFQTKTDVNRLNGLVRDDKCNTAKLDLYAKKVDIPALKDLVRDYDGDSHTITSLTGLDETPTADYGIAMAYADSSGAEQGSRQGVSAAGVYTLTVTLNPAWGVWTGEGADSHSMTITVKKAKINLADNNVLSWDAWDVTNPAAETPVGLLGGTLYISGQSNVSLQPNGGTETPVASSYVRYLDSRTVGLRIHPHAHYQATEYFYTTEANRVGMWDTQATVKINDDDLNNYEFSSVPVEGETRNFGVRVVLAADGTATVTKTWYIVQVGNWITAFVDGQTPDEDSSEYTLLTNSTLTGWEYGSEVSFNTPDLIHGDKQNIKFTLTRDGVIAGDADKLAVWDAEGANVFGDYFNKTMPAGEYVLTIEVESLTVGATTYPSIERIYRFKVSKRTFTQEERKIVENAIKGVTFEYLQDGIAHIWEGGLSAVISADKDGRNDQTYTELERLLTERGSAGTPWHVEPEGIWADEAYADLYKPAALTYNLYRMQNNDYVSDGYFNGPSTTLLKGTGSYTVYYQFSAPSYEPLVDVSSDVRRANYFNVIIYQILEVPEYSTSLVYTGARNTPYVAGSDYYAIDWDSDDEYTDANVRTESGFTPIIHKIILRSYDKNLYRWAEPAEGVTDYYIDAEDSAKMVLTYKITPAANRWTIAPRIVSWTWSAYDAEINRIMAVPYYGSGLVKFAVYKGTVTGNDIQYNDKLTEDFVIDKDGNIPESVSEIFKNFGAGNYRLSAWVEAGANFSGVSDQPFDFIVSPATNRWASTPNVIRWSWSGYDKNVNLITATPYYTDPLNGQPAPSVSFTVLDSDRNPVSELLTGFTTVNGVVSGDTTTKGTVAYALDNLPRGTYFLRTELAETDNYTAIPASDMQFEVGRANNYWKTSPGMTGWQYKAFAVDSNFIEGDPEFITAGKSITYYIFKSKTAPAENQALNPETDREFTDIADVEEFLKALTNGEYWLVATVEGSNDFTGLRAAVPFAVSPSVGNAWGDPAPAISGWVYMQFNDNLVTEGKVTHGTLEYTLAVRDAGDINAYDSMGAGYENLTFEQLLAVLGSTANPFGAGYYRLTVQTVENPNYAQAKRDLFFIVRKADNQWNPAPAVEGWIYGSTANTPNAYATKYPNGGFEYEYYKAKSNGSFDSYFNDDHTVAPTEAGLYALKVTAKASDNYGELTGIAYFQIEQLPNAWKDGHKPEATLSWTWGETVENKRILIAEALKGDVEFVIEGNKSDENLTPVTLTFKNIEALGGIKAALQSLGAGTYNVTASVEGSPSTYTGISTTTSVTVNKADLGWETGTAPADDEWVWGKKTDGSFNAPVPEGVAGEEKITVEYRVDYTPNTGANQTFTYKNAADLEDLFNVQVNKPNHAGVYVLTVTAKDSNYNEFTGTATFTVNKAPNDWKTNAPKNVEADYKTFEAADFPAPTFVYGADSGKTVKYSLSGEGTSTTIENLLTWANGLEAQDSTHSAVFTVVASVEGTNDYTPISTQFTVTVRPIARSWTNKDDVTGHVEAKTYAETLSFVITVPVMNPVPDGGGSVSYAMTYAGDDKELTVPKNPTANILNTYFQINSTNTKAKPAGTYTITVTYDSGNRNVQSLSYTLKITINKGSVGWINGTTPAEMVNFPYEDAAMTVPTAGEGHKVSYKLTDSKGSTYTPAEGKELNAWLNDFPVGTYKLEAFVAETVNYGSVSAHTTIIITKAPNGWDTVGGVDTTPVPSVNWVKGGENDITIPVPLRGTLGITISGGTLTTDRTPSVSELKNVLEGLSAGVYNIKYEVAEDDNYVGIKAETQFVMSLQTNGWGTPLAETYERTWEKDKGIVGLLDSEGNPIPDIPTPTATNAQNNVVKFDIVSITAGVTYSATDISAAEFEQWLKDVRPAVYRVTYKVTATEQVAGMTDTTVITVNKKANSWITQPETGANNEIQWTYGADDNKTIAFAAEYETQSVKKIVVDGTAVNDLASALSGLSVGRHTVRVEISASDYYTALSREIILRVVRGENGWATQIAISGWMWEENSGADIAWTAPKPNACGKVNITVSKVNGSAEEEVFTFNLTYTATDGGEINNVDLLEARLKLLDAGNYKIKAEIPESVNWGGTFVETKNFTVAPNENSFKKEPTVSGWKYDGETVRLPQGADVKYGNEDDIVYTYYYLKDAEGNAVAGAPVKVTAFDKAGTYKFVATLAGSAVGNYPELSCEHEFVVEAGTDMFTVRPNAIGWTWGKFDKNANRFIAESLTGRTVRFTVYKDEACTQTVADLIDFTVTAGVADSTREAALKGLSAGTYWFKAVVGKDERYSELSVKESFKVDLAENGFTESPIIAGWSVANWQASANKPSAASEYGDITMKIYKVKSANNGNAPDRDDDGIEIYSGTLLSNGKFVDDRDEAFLGLMRADTGWYKLTAVTAAESGHYSSVTEEFYFQVYQGSEARPANRWVTMPFMESWTAYDTAIPTKPEGAALRSTQVTYTYYLTKYEGGKYVKVEDSATSVLPVKPGKYIVRIDSVNHENGVHIESDDLFAEVPFEIYFRQNSWTIDPNIENWQLGTGKGNPVAEAKYTQGGGIVFEYKKKGTDDNTKTDKLPEEKGEYVMIVTATATDCEPLEARVEFSVTLSQNVWINIPVINGWSTEFDPNDPTGKAAVGTVVYTYKTIDGKDLGEEKPTEEGTYIMYATVKADGYEDLVSDGYEFTITAAWDTTLLTIDLVLASVLCALTVVVIIFAIRRYKENG